MTRTLTAHALIHLWTLRNRALPRKRIHRPKVARGEGGLRQNSCGVRLRVEPLRVRHGVDVRHA